MSYFLKSQMGFKKCMYIPFAPEKIPLGIFLKSKNQIFIFNRGTLMAASPTSFDISTPRGHFGS